MFSSAMAWRHMARDILLAAIPDRQANIPCPRLLCMPSHGSMCLCTIHLGTGRRPFLRHHMPASHFLVPSVIASQWELDVLRERLNTWKRLMADLQGSSFCFF